jgi:hypothetical protein
MTTVTADLVDFALWSVGPVATLAVAARLYGDAAGGRGLHMGCGGRPSRKLPDDDEHALWIWNLKKPSWLAPMWLMLLTSLLFGLFFNAYGTWCTWRTQDYTNNLWLTGVCMNLIANALSFVWPYALLKHRSLWSANVYAFFTLACYIVANVMYWILWAVGADSTALTPYVVQGPVVHLIFCVWVLYCAACTWSLTHQNKAWAAGAKKDAGEQFRPDVPTLKARH